jgi:hypothetical protein
MQSSTEALKPSSGEQQLQPHAEKSPDHKDVEGLFFGWVLIIVFAVMVVHVVVTVTTDKRNLKMRLDRAARTRLRNEDIFAQTIAAIELQRRRDEERAHQPTIPVTNAEIAERRGRRITRLY